MTHKKRRKTLVEELTPAKRNQAFLAAAKEGNTSYMLKLQRDGADITCTNEKKETALHLAARHGKIEAIEALMNLGADETALDRQGRTPFVLAAHYEQHSSLQAMYGELFLLPEGMELQLKDGSVALPEFFYVSPVLSSIVDELPGGEVTIKLPDFTKKQIELVFGLSRYLFALHILGHHMVDPTGIAHMLYTTELYDKLVELSTTDLKLLQQVAEVLQIQALTELIPDAYDYCTLLSSVRQ